MKVEPEDFCDKLERLLNASPQPCLIGFLKVCSNKIKGLHRFRQVKKGLISIFLFICEKLFV